MPFKTILREEFPLTGVYSDHISLYGFHGAGIKDMYLHTNSPKVARSLHVTTLREMLIRKLKRRLETSGDRLLVAGNYESYWAYPDYCMPKDR